MNSKSPLARSTPEPARPVREGLRPVLTVGLGLLIIAVITPLSQFLTILTVNTEVETATPAGWVLGIVFSLVLAGFALRSLARRDWWSRQELALLYTMLAIAVPVMNLGLIRPFFNATHAVMREYLYQGTSTYRTAYNVLDERWFPKVPTREGLAFNRADRLLRLLDDADALRRQREARRSLLLALTDEWSLQQLLATAVDTADAMDAERLGMAVGDLGYDGVQDIFASTATDVLDRIGWLQPLQQRAQHTHAASAAALTDLVETLPEFGEWEASLLASNQAGMDYSARERLREATDQLPETAETALRASLARLQAHESAIRKRLAALSFSDRQQLLLVLQQREQSRIDGLSDAAFDQERNDFVFRLTREERRALIRQDGLNGPNQNLWAFEYSLWSDAQAREVRDRSSIWQNFQHVLTDLPWRLYLQPLLAWGLLFGLIYFFLMCLAEFFRRKWVSRENLAFPLVEIADHLIRHDYQLESGSESGRPAKRGSAFSALALLGFACGFLLLCLEAMGHYGFINGAAVLKFDLNVNLFDPAGGAMRDIPRTVFVLSPIIVGLVFLLSLEMGLSIWVCFLMYTIAAWLVKLMFPNMLDSNWTGFGDGRLHPYPMEQMLGACAVFAVYAVWKSRTPATEATGDAGADGGDYLPRGLTRWGLILAPLAIFALLWSLGVRSLGLLLVIGLATLAVTIAAARVRAETGLPTFHVFYESTKLPLIFGLTGMAGAKAYAAFINIVFMPLTLLFRTLPQQLENMELARRYRISFRTIAVSGAAAFAVAVAVGMFSFLIFVYGIGRDFYGATAAPPQAGSPTPAGLATYPLWVSHFLGEPGLDKFDHINAFRIGAMAVGASVIGVMLYLRNRYLRFPLHPIGYLVIILSIHYSWVSPYMRVHNEGISGASTIWGGAFVAWLLKKLIVKYGGMNAYKRAKPFFIGMVIGAVCCIFLWNSIHLCANLLGLRADEPGAFIRRFLEVTPYIPAVY